VAEFGIRCNFCMTRGAAAMNGSPALLAEFGIRRVRVPAGRAAHAAIFG